MAIRDRLALTDDERTLQATLRDFLGEQLPSATLRAALDSDAGFSPELDMRLSTELGLAGLGIPEEHGGLGMTETEASVVHAELGRALYPGPFLPRYLAAAALVAAGDKDACQRWLPGLAAGTVTGTVAFAGRDGSWLSGPGSVTYERDGTAFRLHGSRWYVPAAHMADFLIIPAWSGAGPALFLAEAPAAGLTVTPSGVLDLTRRVSGVRCEQVTASPIATGEAADSALLAVRAEFELAIAAEAAGGIGWCLDTAVSYAKDRHQFGRPIGSFQAIAHQCADLLADLHAASATARYAAAATAERAPDAPLATQVAVLRAGEAYRHAAETTIHILGGTGFTWEHDAHLYYRRAWSAQQLSGRAADHRDRIAELAGL